MARLKVGVLCGGQSAEHEVSLQSARNIVAALSPDKYLVEVLGISKHGQWFRLPQDSWLSNPSDPEKIALCLEDAQEIIIKPWKSDTSENPDRFDVVIPALHGPRGEDGCVQGMLNLAGIPYVGAGVLGSAVGMDKDVMKRLLRDANLPIGKFITLTTFNASFESLTAALGTPLFIKPANMGSSVGVAKVTTEEQFNLALADALRFDTKILVEQFIPGREIECAVLGNEEPRASLPGELIPSHDFYSYEAKYLDATGARVEIPADLPPDIIQAVQELSIAVFKTLECHGLARVDFFLTPANQLVVNEINTFPGFTSISMYPKLWEASGITLTELLDNLIDLALQRFRKQSALTLCAATGKY